MDAGDAVLDALDAVLASVASNQIRLEQVMARAEDIREQRRQGRKYADIVRDADQPLIVELLTANLRALQQTGSQLRSAEARALYQEGLTMDEVAALFGVSRQRVSALLRSDGERPPLDE